MSSNHPKTINNQKVKQKTPFTLVSKKIKYTGTNVAKKCTRPPIKTIKHYWDKFKKV
jgi:hypothetical protein